LRTIETLYSPFYFQAPDAASVCSTAHIDPKFCSPALSRHSFETIITESSIDELQHENIYQLPDNVVKSESYKRHSAAYLQQYSIDYDESEQQPDHIELEPEYQELEPELNLTGGGMKQNLPDESSKECGKGMPLWKPTIPRKPTVLRTMPLFVNSSFEEEEGYYSEALGSMTDLSPEKIEELYAKVDKSRKGK